MNPIAIQTNALSRSFEALKAVDRLSIEVPTGSIFGFLGPNGSGKTTTIRLLLGLLAPTEGSGRVLGHDIRSEADAIRLKSGALLEHNGLYQRLSAENNLDFYGEVWHMPTVERKRRIQELLTHLDLWERRTEIVGRWSRGMQQKLAIARTLLHHPALVFMDEPTAGLDPLAAAALHKDLASLAEKEGVTIFMTTHNLAEAEKLCQQVAVIRKGRLLATGPLEALRAQAGGPRLEVLGRDFTPQALEALQARPEVLDVAQQNNRLLINLRQASDTSSLVGLLIEQGVQVDEVRKGKANLEEVFITLMEEDAEAES
ncbi:MAG: ABC transporter ATP-binding protein [Anaerolineales bacterium]|nr:MAG: ABC transporter ATP-binding protein [Anaerolineales bacterium]